MLSIIGAGLSRTGTKSLHLALQVLGFNSLHFDQRRLNDILEGAEPNPNFRRYDDVDAVSDIPSAFFYRELFQAYPDAKVILTVRELEDWWKSIAVHFNVAHPVSQQPRLRYRLAAKFGLGGMLGREAEFDVFRRALRNYIYGSTRAQEFLYKKRYTEHNDQVVATIPPDRLLVMNISRGDGWEKLCPFLGVPVPETPFPHGNETNYNNPTPWMAPTRSKAR